VRGEIMKRLKERFAMSGLPPSSRLEILNLFLELGKWMKANPFPVHFDSRLDLYRYIDGEIIGGGPIDYMEFGVYKGDAIRFWSGLNRHPDSRLEALVGSYDAEPAASGLVSQYKNLLHHYMHQHGRREAATFWSAAGPSGARFSPPRADSTNRTRGRRSKISRWATACGARGGASRSILPFR
jgi:hypothetical protein